MKIHTIYISAEDRELRIGDILKKKGHPMFLPSNVIMDKVRPNFGATQLEIDCKRHSIIIIPLIEVMTVKKFNSMNEICVVNGDLKVQEIIDYFQNDNVIYKKFMVTPDSFIKLFNTLTKLTDIYNQFYLLYDECDQLITNCLFRKNLLKPLDYFFNFKDKAMISATPIIPNDPRFKENGFTILRFQPLFDYKEKLTLITTNNIRRSIKNLVSIYNDDRPVFIFSNCVQTMLYASRLEFVEHNHKIFCAEQIEREFFIKQGAEDIYNTVVGQEFAKFNFLTSRFFAGLDIYLPLNPHIIYITNIPYSKHSIIDPFTDAVQIMGRLRNGVQSITHLTKLYKGLEFKDGHELEVEFDFCHKLISRLNISGLDFNNSTIKEVLDAITDHSVYKMLGISTEDKNYVYYKQCQLHKLKVENYYSNANALRNAYESTLHFKVMPRIVIHASSDEDRLRLSRTIGRERRRDVAFTIIKLIEFYIDTDTSFDEDFFEAMEEFRQMEELVYELVMKGCFNEIAAMEFRIKDLRELYFTVIINERKHNYADMIDRILTSFSLNRRYYTSDVKQKLQGIYNEFKHSDGFNKLVKAKASQILNYFEGRLIEPSRPDKVRKYETYYILGRPKYSLSSDLELLGNKH